MIEKKQKIRLLMAALAESLTKAIDATDLEELRFILVLADPSGVADTVTDLDPSNALRVAEGLHRQAALALDRDLESTPVKGNA